ncbi:MAG: butyrate kinase [Anaerovoracaceae bacterium]
MKELILCLNFGSTSSKISLFKGEEEIASKSISYTAEKLSSCKSINDQLAFRESDARQFLTDEGVCHGELSAIMARAGVTKPVGFGAYVINDCMIDRLLNKPIVEHAMNLTPVVAHRIALDYETTAMTYDSCTTDQMEPLFKLSGIPEITRSHMSHIENIRAVAFKYAENIGKKYEDLNLIVSHLGGGISATAHRKGRVIDSIDSNDGSFSPERAGILPSRALAKLIYSNRFTEKELYRRLEGNGGMVAYLGTSDAREVEKQIANGDEKAELVYRAMASQISKSVGQLSTDLNGEVDAIILTGGLANSNILMGWISERVSFIAPVVLYPGEYEMEALAKGAVRVLSGREKANIYEE